MGASLRSGWAVNAAEPVLAMAEGAGMAGAGSSQRQNARRSTISTVVSL